MRDFSQLDCQSTINIHWVRMPTKKNEPNEFRLYDLLQIGIQYVKKL